MSIDEIRNQIRSYTNNLHSYVLDDKKIQKILLLLLNHIEQLEKDVRDLKEKPYDCRKHMKNILEAKALAYAQVKHATQLDDIGKPYINHLVQVADILKHVTNDEEIICAGYLHDTLEDTETTFEELQQTFGEIIANLVNEVTHEGRKDEIGFYFPRLHSRDAILIKFADRLSNLSRMQNWDIKRQEHYLRKSKFWKSE